MRIATFFNRAVVVPAFALICFVPIAWGRHSNSAGQQLSARPCDDTAWIVAQRQAGVPMAQQIMATSMPWTDDKVNAYVNRLGQRLVSSSGSHQAFTFRVLYAHRVNAQAVPGGFVFVNSGVISRAESEAELAAVLAHGIAHENTCYVRESFRTSSFWSRMAGEGLHSRQTKASSAALRVGGDGFSEFAELEADKLAASYLARAGYDPRAALRVLERAETDEERRGAPHANLPSANSTLTLRRRNLERILDSLPTATPTAENSADFNEARAEIRAYDEVFSRMLDVPLPGEAPAPPKLRRRLVARQSP